MNRRTHLEWQLAVWIECRICQVELQVYIAAARKVATFQCRAVQQQTDEPRGGVAQIDLSRAMHDLARFEWHRRRVDGVQ